MASNLSLFAGATTSNNSIINAGSKLLVTALPSGYIGETGPPEVTLTQKAATAVDVGDEVLIVNISGATSVIIRDGAVLVFGASETFVVKGTQIVSGTDFELDIYPATTGNTLSGGETCITWGLLALDSPSDLPLNETSAMEDRKDLTYGLQGSQNKVGVAFAPQITCFATPEDTAYWKYIKPYSGQAGQIFAVLYRGDGLWAAGAALVSNLTENGAVNTQVKPTFTLEFQAPYALPTKYEYLTTEQQAEAQLIMKKAGLPIFV